MKEYLYKVKCLKCGFEYRVGFGAGVAFKKTFKIECGDPECDGIIDASYSGVSDKNVEKVFDGDINVAIK